MRSQTFRRSAALWFVLAVVFAFPVESDAQSSIIDANRRVDWSAAGSTSIATPRTTICTTLSAGATAADINTAIAACPDGQVVKLNAGTYSLAGGIIFNGKSGVTLRGAGADQTILNFTGWSSCGGLGSVICVKNGNSADPSAPSNTANWTAGYTKGATSITLSNTTNLAVGRLLILDQENEATDTGNVWNCSETGVCSNGGPAGGGRPTTPRREQLQIVRVSAISGNTVTISPGLYMPNWRAGQNPGAWWANNDVERVGIEDLRINGSTVDTNHIVFMYAADSWVKNVASHWAGPRSHVWVWIGKNITVRDSYFFEGNQHGSQSYGVESLMASDLLIENNIFQRVTAPVIFNGPSSGSVAAYNYLREMTYTNSVGWMIPSNDNHSTGLNMVLTEGNEGTGFIFDNVHGPGAFMTVFRNRFIGWETGKDSQTTPIHVYHYSRYFNVIGNVLGDNVYHDAYNCAATSAGQADMNCYKYIYTLGWSGNNGQKSAMPNDPMVASTMFRWGNYDTVNDAARFEATEVPSGLPLYANAVPADNTLPASLYLSAKPAWFGSVTYPAIGPDVTGGDGPGGKSYKIPARLCYDATPKDTDGSLLFESSDCYATQGGTSAIVWESLVNTTVSGTTITKTAGTTGGGTVAGAISQQTIATTGTFTFTLATGPSVAGFDTMNVGLSSDTAIPGNTETMLHAWRFSSVNVEIRENGGYAGETTWVVGDVFTIEVTATQVIYKKNGTTIDTNPLTVVLPTKLKLGISGSNGIGISNATVTTAGGEPPPTTNEMTVCASGCDYTNTQLQTAINAAAAATGPVDVVLQEGFTYVGDFTMPVKADASATNRIVIRTGVNSTGVVQATTRYPADNVRVCPAGYSSDWYSCTGKVGETDLTRFAKLQPQSNGVYAIRTAATGTGAPVSYYELRWLEFVPNAYAGNSLVGITNDTADTNGDPATKLPHHITVDRIVLNANHTRQFRGIQMDGNTLVLKNSHLTTAHESEGQTIWANTSIGPMEITNNYASGGTEVLLTGGGMTTIRPMFTVQASPAPTTTAVTLNAATDLYAGKNLAFEVGRVAVTSISTTTNSTVTTSAAHGYTVGHQVDFDGVTGCTNATGYSINNQSARINTIPTSTTFTINLTCTTAGSGGTVATRAQAEIATITGNAVTLTPALPIAPVAGDEAESSVVIRNMTVRYNVFTRPSAWRTTNPNSYQVKNTFELKQGRDSTIEYNIIEYSWTSGQNGPCVVLTGTQQWNEADSAVIRNIDFRYNVVRECGEFIRMSSTDALGHESARSGNIRVTDNLAYNIGEPYGGSYGILITASGGGGDRQTPNRGADNMTFEHNTIRSSGAKPNFVFLLDYCHNWPTQTPSKESTSPNTIIRNNIIYNGLYGMGSINPVNADCTGGATSGRIGNPPLTGTSVVSQNALVGGTCSLYSTNSTNMMCPSAATFEADAFTNTTTISGFNVKPTSVYAAGNASDATDNKDLGADIDTITTAMAITQSGDNTGQAPVPDPLTITNTSPLPTGLVGQAYTQTLTATGGTTPYTWAHTTGTLPTGLTFNAATATLSGTPTSAAVNRSLTFQVTDATAQQVSKTLVLTISPFTQRASRYNWAEGATWRRATAPTNPGDQVWIGDTWFDTTTNRLKVATALGPPITWSIVTPTLAAGSNITLTPNAGGDTITIASTAAGGATGAPAVQTIPLWAGPVQTMTPAVTPTNALNEFPTQRSARLKADVENSTQCALNVSLVEGSSVVGNTLKLQYWTGAAWADAGCSAAIDVAGPVIVEGTFATFTAGARTQDRIFRAQVATGDGVDTVQIGTVTIRLR